MVSADYERWDRYRRFSSYALVAGYVFSIWFEFLMFEAVWISNGNWQFVQREGLTSAGWMVWLLSILFGVLPAFFYVPAFVIAQKRQRRHPLHTYGLQRDVVSLWGLAEYFAWYQVGYALFFIVTLITGWPLFDPGTIFGILEGAAFHLLMIFLFFMLFSRYRTEFGFRNFAPPGKRLQALFFVFLFFVFILYALDPLITYPVADFFHIELDSWREEEITREIMQARNNGWLTALVQMAMIGLVVPLAEEIMFRGVFQTILTRYYGAVLGVILSAFIFALIHIDPALMAPLLVMGFMLAWLRHRFVSIWPAVLLHALNNTFSVLYFYL